jgi:hypothetical protein
VAGSVYGFVYREEVTIIIITQGIKLCKNGGSGGDVSGLKGDNVWAVLLGEGVWMRMCYTVDVPCLFDIVCVQFLSISILSMQHGTCKSKLAG